MGEDFALRIGCHMLIDNIHDAAFIGIMRQNRNESDRFGLNIIDDMVGISVISVTYGSHV